jgi:site-specific recombinase XerC
VQDITSNDVWSVIDEARRRAIPGTTPRTLGISEARALHMRNALGGLFEWLHRNRRVEHNPVDGLHRPEASKARERVLPADEIRLFWRACDEVGEPFGTIYRLLL